jgi:hypothetical protein
MCKRRATSISQTQEISHLVLRTIKLKANFKNTVHSSSSFFLVVIVLKKDTNKQNNNHSIFLKQNKKKFVKTLFFEIIIKMI